MLRKLNKTQLVICNYILSDRCPLLILGWRLWLFKKMLYEQRHIFQLYYNINTKTIYIYIYRHIQSDSHSWSIARIKEEARWIFAGFWPIASSWTPILDDFRHSQNQVCILPTQWSRSGWAQKGINRDILNSSNWIWWMNEKHVNWIVWNGG